jgi:prephenate dehydrogenase
MRNVAIAGVGLIGGSFALALRKAGFTGRITGIGSPQTIQRALELGVIEAAPDPAQALAEADTVYLAYPISRILGMLEGLGARIKPGALVTDAGSTKSAIMAKAASERLRFLGGHPMAGKELRGVGAADADLFRGRTYFLTPTQPEEEFVEWIRRIGGHPVLINAEEHDRLVAVTSHLPQMLSTALASMASELPVDRAVQGSGPGMLDMTRLAGSAWEIWADILATNAQPIDAAITAYIERLRDIQCRLKDTSLQAEFEKAGDVSRRLRHPAR